MCAREFVPVCAGLDLARISNRVAVAITTFTRIADTFAVARDGALVGIEGSSDPPERTKLGDRARFRA